jgi:hypothetical protein
MKTFRITILDDNRNTLFFYNVDAESQFMANQKGRRILDNTSDTRAFFFEIEQLTF